MERQVVYPSPGPSREAGLGGAVLSLTVAQVTLAAGTHDVYLGLAGVAVVTTAAVLIIVPRHFATRDGSDDA